MTGVELIAKERQEQTEKHEWTAKHDDSYQERELAHAARTIILYADTPSFEVPREGWPWSRAWWHRIQNHSEIERLAIAGALVAAELDRLLRQPTP